MKSVVISGYETCALCEELAKNRANIVWGYGVPYAPIMCIGEGPGKSEDKEGRPFVGKAGVQYWYMLQEAGISEKMVYTTNAVLCRPTKSTPLAGVVENRPPNSIEINNCRPRLLREICKMDPFVIIAFGGVAMTSLFGKEIKISTVVGNIMDVKIKTENGNVISYPVMPVFHPSYLMRDAAESEMGQEHEALKFVKQIVDAGMAR